MWPFVKSRFERVVAVEHDPVHDHFVVYQRLQDDSVSTISVHSRHFFIVDDPAFVPRNGHELTTLAGEHPLRYLVLSDSLKVHLDGLKHARQEARLRHGENASSHIWQRGPVECFLIRSGTTLFSSLLPSDLKVAALDLEVYTSKAKLFASAADIQDKIILATLADNRGNTYVLDERELGEKGLMEELCRLIRTADYDVLCGHNISGFDLPYLAERANIHKLSLRLGRDGSVLQVRDSRKRYAARDRAEYFIFGRHVIDTLPLLMQWDITNRTLLNFQLKEAIAALGLGVDRRDFDRSDISALWDSGDKRLKDYALADACDSLNLYNFLTPSPFYQTQLLPLTYQQCVSTGTGSKVDMAMIRAYLDCAHSLPIRGAMVTGEGTGGLTEVRSLGWHAGVHKADVASLYPSICLSYEVKPRTDTLGAFPRLLRALTERRLAAKAKLKELPKGSYEFLATDALQNSLKILINSFYGMLGTEGLHFSDSAASNEITARGQAILLYMVGNAERSGGTVIELDTDGIYFTLPNANRSDGDIAALIAEGLHGGIRVEYDGYYDYMYSYACKNYLLFNNDKVTRKGVVFRSRRLYGLQEAFIALVVRHLQNQDVWAMCSTYRNFSGKIRRGGLTRVEVTSHVSVDTTWEEYAAHLAAGGQRTRAFDLVRTRDDRERWGLRSRIYYYHGPNGELKLSEEYTQDYDVGQYLDILKKTAEKFLYILPPEDWHRVFGESPITEKEAERIRLWSFSPQAHPEIMREYQLVLDGDFQLRLF